MAVTVFSDPHLGRTMQAHTTASSRARLTQAIFDTVISALDAAPVGAKVCAGDLFDKYQNTEAILQQGVKVAQRCTHIMAGNHDVTADVNKVGSLQFLAGLEGEATGCDIMLSRFGQSECYLKRVGSALDFVFVPHHTTDGLFQQSLTDAAEWAHQRRITRSVKSPAYLVLHCNYDCEHAVDETALNLTKKQAKWLLDAGFDYILLGHDHHPREDFDGRLIILGNTHPTGFGDISPKRMLIIHDDGRHEFKTIWDPAERYAIVSASNLIDASESGEWFAEAGLSTVAPPDFVQIDGMLEARDAMKLAKAIRALWEKFSPLAVRNNTMMMGVQGNAFVPTAEFEAIDKVIRADLAGEPELLGLFESYWARTAPDATEE